MPAATRFVVIGSLVAASMLVAGCASGRPSATGTAGRQPAPPPATAARPAADTTASLNPGYTSPDGKSQEEHIAALYNTLDAPSEITAKMSVAFAVPARLGTDAQTRARVLKEAGVNEIGVVDFTGNRSMSILRFRNEGEARSYVAQDVGVDFAPHNRVVWIAQHEGRAMDKLDVPPVDDPKSQDPAYGTKVRATGIYTGSAKVEWSIGRYVISVTDTDGGVDQLLADVQAAWGSK